MWDLGFLFDWTFSPTPEDVWIGVQGLGFWGFKPSTLNRLGGFRIWGLGLGFLRSSRVSPMDVAVGGLRIKSGHKRSVGDSCCAFYMV